MNLKNIISFDQFAKKLSDLKNNNKRFISNSYLSADEMLPLIDDNKLSLCSLDNSSFLLLENNNGFYYCYYFLNKETDFIFPNSIKACIAILSKGVDRIQIPDFMQNNNFSPYRLYTKMVKKNLNQNNNITIPNLTSAEVSDIAEINIFLNKYFDPISEYIPDDLSLQKIIINDQILTYKSKNKIIGLLTFDIKGSVSTLLHIAVDDESRGKNIAAMLLNQYFLKTYNDILSYQLWVDIDNISAINFYHKYDYSDTNILNNTFINWS